MWRFDLEYALRKVLQLSGCRQSSDVRELLHHKNRFGSACWNRRRPRWQRLVSIGNWGFEGLFALHIVASVGSLPTKKREHSTRHPDS